MKTKSFEQAIRSLIRATPFRPFVVDLVSGSRIQVQHPEALAMGGSVAVHVAPDGTPCIFDSEGVSQIIARQERSKQAS